MSGGYTLHTQTVYPDHDTQIILGPARRLIRTWYSKEKAKSESVASKDKGKQ